MLNRYVLTLLFVTLVWGATFPVMKLATASLSGLEISALRFIVAAVCMAPFALRASKAAWRDGLVLGTVALVSYVTQAWGLQYISSNRSAFITTLNVLMVPLLGFLFFGSRPTKVLLVAAVLACVGIGLMSWDGGAHLWADLATVVCALAYALYVILLSQRTSRHSAREFAATQIVWMAVLGNLWLLAANWGNGQFQTLPDRALTQSAIASLLYLGIIATAGMLFLQAVAQRHVSADKAAVIYAMEPVFAALIGWLWLSEVLSISAALGGAMVVGAVLLSESRAASSAPRAKNEGAT
ncbi:MAG: DMT family transporter [Rhodoferax sp.]|nr:DMT family transporter [Rhodoferax sp.]